MMKRFFLRKRFATTFKTKTVEYNGYNYQIRELSTGERIALDEVRRDESPSQIVMAAWIVSKGCAEFSGVDHDSLVLDVSPGCLDFLCSEICDISKLRGEDVDELEKKSESSQN